MACATPVGNNIPFGIPFEELALLTKQVKVSRMGDRKEARDGCGNVQSAVWYNKRSEVSISATGMVGPTLDDVGVTLTLANATTFAGLLVGSLYIDKVTSTMDQEDFQTTEVDAISWDGIP